MSANYNLFYFFNKFPDENACRKYLEQRRWGDTLVCPYCGNSHKIYRYKNGRTFKCSHCKRQFNVTTGTIYQNSNIPLQKWFLTFYLISLSKKGISSVELAKTIGVTQKTAWYLLHKVRYMLEHNKSGNQLQGVVEVDETYVGGKHKGKRGRSTLTKTPVFGAVQRRGRLFITPVPNAKRKTSEPIIRSRVREGTHIMSDEWWAYTKLGDTYSHSVVKHKENEYVRGDIYTNTIEGAWSHLKRSMMGTYHRPSRKHLSKYCAEFEFTYNTRNYSPLAIFNNIIDKNLIRVGYSEIVGT